MLLLKFLKDESGATAIEYGLIIALVSAAIVGGATSLGSSLGTSYDDAGAAFD